jgi:hypothetical protein
MLYFLNLDWGRTPKGVTPTVTEIRSNPECCRSIIIIIYLFIYLSIYLFFYLFYIYIIVIVNRSNPECDSFHRVFVVAALNELICRTAMRNWPACPLQSFVGDIQC